MASILVCDDMRAICGVLEIALRKQNYRVETVTSGSEAKRKLDSNIYDVVVSDIKMPQTDGIEVLRHARRVSPETAVILITAIEDYEAAVQAVKAGAFDYIHKGPHLIEEVGVAIKRDAGIRNSLDNIVGASSAMGKLKQTIRTVASSASTVVIQGESGTGKELVARAIHACSPRAAEPFVSINCGEQAWMARATSSLQVPLSP